MGWWWGAWWPPGIDGAEPLSLPLPALTAPAPPAAPVVALYVLVEEDMARWLFSRMEVRRMEVRASEFDPGRVIGLNASP